MCKKKKTTEFEREKNEWNDVLKHRNERGKYWIKQRRKHDKPDSQENKKKNFWTKNKKINEKWINKNVSQWWRKKEKSWNRKFNIKK